MTQVLNIAACEEDVPRASAWMAQTAGELGVPDDPVMRLDLCLNEALANVIDHGGPDARTAPIRIELEVGPASDIRREARITVTDAGRAFDPRFAEIAPRPTTLEEAVPGGLGILMIRNFSDALDYRREAGLNHLSFTVRWDR